MSDNLAGQVHPYSDFMLPPRPITVSPVDGTQNNYNAPVYYNNYYPLQIAGGPSEPQAGWGYTSFDFDHHGRAQFHQKQYARGPRHNPIPFRPYHVPPANYGSVTPTPAWHPQQSFQWPELSSSAGPCFKKPVSYKNKASPGNSGGSACSRSPLSDPSIDGGAHNSPPQQPDASPSVNVGSDHGALKPAQKIAAKCSVCSRPASGIHYNAVTCDGCKSFFRRFVCSQKRYPCLNRAPSASGTCPVIIDRAGCKGCRQKLCLRAGMDPLLVQVHPKMAIEMPTAASWAPKTEVSQPLLGSEEAWLPSSTEFDSPLLRGLLTTQNLVTLTDDDLKMLPEFQQSTAPHPCLQVTGPQASGLEGSGAQANGTQGNGSQEWEREEYLPHFGELYPSPEVVSTPVYMNL